MRRKENNRTNEHLNCATQTNIFIFHQPWHRDHYWNYKNYDNPTCNNILYYIIYTSDISSPSQSHTNSVYFSFQTEYFWNRSFWVLRKGKIKMAFLRSNQNINLKRNLRSPLHFQMLRIHLSGIQKLKKKKNVLLYNFPSVGIINVNTHVLLSQFHKLFRSLPFLSICSSKHTDTHTHILTHTTIFVRNSHHFDQIDLKKEIKHFQNRQKSTPT